MVVELTMDYYKNPETGDFYRDIDGDATYTEYFKWKEPSFYYELMDILSIEDTTDRKQRISTMIDNIFIKFPKEHLYNGYFSKTFRFPQ